MFGVYDIPTNCIHILRRVVSDVDNSVEVIAQFPCRVSMAENYERVFIMGSVPMRFRIQGTTHVLQVVCG